MKIIHPDYFIETNSLPSEMYERIEKIARTCYKSEGKGNAKKFIARLIEKGHEAMIEHEYITVRFIHNRGFSHELVRHRLASYAQESTRYCNYSNDKFGSELTFVEPYWFKEECIDKEIAIKSWLRLMENIETDYIFLTKGNKLPAQAARGILPNDIKTEIVITANLREWRNILYYALVIMLLVIGHTI